MKIQRKVCKYGEMYKNIPKNAPFKVIRLFYNVKVTCKRNNFTILHFSITLTHGGILITHQAQAVACFQGGRS